MEPFEPNPLPEEPRDDPETGLEESVWQLELGGNEPPPAFPMRPGRPDCAYYMRTGTCGYGDGCRYHHPRVRGTVRRAARTGSEEHPERISRPACRYFIKHGTCNYGDTCKFEHPRQDGSMPLTSINKYGYPLRPGEKDCSYYVRTGHCKFGLTCKFNHPEVFGATLRLPASPSYPMVQPSAAPPQQYPVISSWEVARRSMLPAAPYIQGPYGPVLLFHGVMPDLGWNTFPASASPLGSGGGQHSTAQGELLYGSAAQYSPLHPAATERTTVQGVSQYGSAAQFSILHSSPTAHATAQGESQYGSIAQFSPLRPAHTDPYPTMASSAGPSTSDQDEPILPERLDEPECQVYETAGYCTFGSRCK